MANSFDELKANVIESKQLIKDYLEALQPAQDQLNRDMEALQTKFLESNAELLNNLEAARQKKEAAENELRQTMIEYAKVAKKDEKQIDRDLHVRETRKWIITDPERALEFCIKNGWFLQYNEKLLLAFAKNNPDLCRKFAKEEIKHSAVVSKWITEY